ncbi:MAG TPA: hybrid sensor histidine kinase/response regulator [Anaerolineae bacterium]|nr:hybrid sensor histidine kinase/response regulator [Anaerolineae bacterium]HID85531.1 hybrid sensor histidine kinase/response regulator [Anaerolineales bacterium]HIQ09162.1 hybrid sensor histidine kinase/response regulator [Anaerolineaceae bacterium]
MHATHRERILVVSGDPEVVNLIARQSLQPLHYHVQVAQSAGEAFQALAKFAPDLILADLDLPDLSAKDFLAALRSQRRETPVVVVAPEKRERDIIQSFRLGAMDYLGLPAKETEVVAVVERALKAVRERREREYLARRLEQTNQALRRRLGELDLLFRLAKELTSVSGAKALYQHLVDQACEGLGADVGWLVFREEKSFRLVAHRNVSKTWVQRAAHQWDDGLSSLVAFSGEPLNIHGEPLKRFKAAHLGQAALVAPVRVKERTIAVLGVARKALKPFATSDQALLQAIADLAAISLVNLELFRALDERAKHFQRLARAAQRAEQLKSAILQNLAHELRAPLGVAIGYVDMLATGQMGKLSVEQREALDTVKQKLNRLDEAVNSLLSLGSTLAPERMEGVNLSKVVQAAAEMQRPRMKEKGLSFTIHLPEAPVVVYGDARFLGKMLAHLLDKAFKFTPKGGSVTVALEERDGHALLKVQDTGVGIPKEALSRIFEPFYQADQSTARRFGGLGLGLAVVKEIVQVHNGRVWAESEPGQGTTVWVRFPLMDADQGQGGM